MSLKEIDYICAVMTLELVAKCLLKEYVNSVYHNETQRYGHAILVLMEKICRNDDEELKELCQSI
jgi:hypothetical protein